LELVSDTIKLKNTLYVRITDTTYTVAANVKYIWNAAGAGPLKITLPDPATNIYRELIIKNTGTGVNSASSNVKPIDSNTAGTVILPNESGSWIVLVSDGQHWIVMQRSFIP
jgi:hypothetical protein